MTRSTASPPFISRLLIVGSGVMSLANSFTVPFLAMLLPPEAGAGAGALDGRFHHRLVRLLLDLRRFVGGSLSDLVGRAAAAPSAR